VGGREVIVLGNGIEGVWRVDMSCSLPSKHKQAAAMVECMRQTFLRAAEQGAPAYEPKADGAVDASAQR
jgi:hypothetical protein